MAITVKYNRQQTLPATLGGRYVDLRGVAAKTGAFVNLGRVAQQRIGELKQERDTTIARAAYHEFADLAREKRTEIEQRKGAAAYNLDEVYDEWFNTAYNDFYETKFDTGAQQTLFRNLTAQRRSADLDRIATYEAAEHQRFKDDTEAGMVLNAQADIRDRAYAFGRDPDGYAQYVEATVDGQIAEMRRMRPHEDITEKAMMTRSALYSAAMQEMIDKDPAAAAQYLEQWKPALGKAYHAWKGRLKTETADTVKSGAFAAVSARYGENYEAAIVHLNDAGNWSQYGLDFGTAGAVAERFRALIADRERGEDEAEENLKKQQEAAEREALIAFNNGEIGAAQADELYRKRLIGREVYNAMRSGGARENDPVVVAEIKQAVAFKQYGAAEALAKDALKKGQIKTETYISLFENAGKEEVKGAEEYVTRALKPYDLRYNPDRAMRYADAMEALDARIRGGENPDKAADDIVSEYLAGQRRTRATLRTSKYLRGKAETIDNIDEAILAAAADYANGNLTTEEYELEIENLKQIAALLAEEQEIGEQTDEMRERISNAKKLSR